MSQSTGVEGQVVEESGEKKRPAIWFILLLTMACVLALAGLTWSYSLAGRLTHAEAQLAATQKQNQQLADALEQTNAKLRVTTKTLGHRVGETQKELARRAQNLLHRQQANAKRLEQEQEGTQTQVSSVTGDVAGVQSDVGGVKGNLQQTQSQLAGDEAQMRKMQGDLGIQSGLIATNAQELEILKHRGDRDYYPFTLRKGKKKAVATIALRLRRVNVKHSMYTMTVFSDDRKIEKKDRSLNEPVQFYTGKQHLLFELVVNKMSHNEVQGYVSTPKNAPKPVVVGKN